MSILSRLLKREGEGEPAAVAPSVQAEPALAGPLPAEEYPESAESTDQSLAVRAEDSGIVLMEAQPATATAPPLPASVRPVPAAPPSLAEQAAPLRDLVLEVRWGTAQPRWLPLARPILQGLRTRIVQETPPVAAPPAAEVSAAPPSAVDSPPDTASGVAAEAASTVTNVTTVPAVPAPDVPGLLDALSAALELAASGPGGAAALGGEARKAVLAAYEPLARARPEVFALAVDGPDGQREQLIVESLLGQVPGLDPLLAGKLSAVGLGRLENLLAASAEEIAGVAGLPEPIAAVLADRVAEFRRSSPPALAADPRAARRQLEPLLGRLEALHAGFERAASGWSDQDVATKRRLRREREQAWMATRAALARQGAVEFLLEIEKLPFGRRIEALGRFLKDPRTATGRGNGGTSEDGRAHA
jgi:hypothetical protein